jgi:hypothetical protein
MKVGHALVAAACAIGTARFTDRMLAFLTSQSALTPGSIIQAGR